MHAVPPAGEATSNEMTFASKLSPDHPGLRLEKPQARSLRRGPMLAIAAILATTVLVAAAVAFSPRSEQARAATPLLPDGTQSKNVTISDTVENAPGNNTDLHPGTPKLGSDHSHGADPCRTAPPGARPGSSTAAGVRQSPRQVIRDERQKAFGSSILVDLENPTQEGLPRRRGQRRIRRPRRHNRPRQRQSGLGASPATHRRRHGRPEHAAAQVRLPHPRRRQHRDLPQPACRHAEEPVSRSRPAPSFRRALLTAINSDLPGQIIGQVRENVYDTVSGNYLLIPQGSKLLATYDSAVSYGQERVLFCWNRLVRPDGVSISLECMPGADLAGSAGVSDDVNHHWWRIITGVALGTLLSATAEHAAGNVTGYQPTVGQAWASNAGGAINSAGQQITQKNLAIQPTITVRAGYSVNVIVSKDIVFPPYANQGASR